MASRKELTREIDVNLSGAIRTVAVLVDRLRANRGTMINVSSSLAYVPLQAAPIYCATKAALHSYTITLRQQLAGEVEVIELMPPAVRTQITEGLPEDGAFSILTTAELVERVSAEDVPAGPVHSLEALIDDPQIRHNGSIVEIEHPEAGTLRQAAPPARFDKTPSKAGTPPPLLGAHTDEILSEIGLDAAALQSLREAGVIA